jgi:hypothetical protein
MSRPGTSSKQLRRDGLRRIAGLLEELRQVADLREVGTGTFMHGSHQLLHFHYHPDGEIVADVRGSDGQVERLDVSDEGGQQEVLAIVESCVGP